MKAKVDRDMCRGTGCELCTSTCPEVFKMEDGLSMAYLNPVPSGSEKDAQQAAYDCPENCISIE